MAVTASCHIISFWGAGLLGILAGLIHNWAFSLLERWNIDDPVGAVPVHAFAGTLGVVMFPFFTDADALNLPLPNQVGIQFLGAVVCFIWAGGTSLIMFFIVEKWIGLRVSPQEEMEGISIPNTFDLFIHPSNPIDTEVKINTTKNQTPPEEDEPELDAIAQMMKEAENNSKS